MLNFKNINFNLKWREIKMAELLVVRSKIKEATQLNVAGDVPEALSESVREIIKVAEKRAKDNGRKTIKAQDL